MSDPTRRNVLVTIASAAAVAGSVSEADAQHVHHAAAETTPSGRSMKRDATEGLPQQELVVHSRTGRRRWQLVRIARLQPVPHVDDPRVQIEQDGVVDVALLGVET